MQFLHIFKQRLIDINFQKWQQDVQSTVKLNHYANYKSELKLEKYLEFNISKYNKCLLTKLRCANLKLEIEHGRHLGLERHQRICKLCHIDTEDNYRFVIACPKLEI